MRREVGAHLEVTVNEAARLEVQIGVASPASYPVVETTEVWGNREELDWLEIDGILGSRLWLIDAPAGRLTIDYHAVLEGRSGPSEDGIDTQLLYLRPSRYCESDRLIGFSSRLFRDINEPTDILAAVSSWVGGQLEYVSGSSGPTDGAVDTLLAGRGVCRDFAHLAVALLRAKGVPARLVAVYAPGLQPMDFHAVAEAYVDNAWYVVDATLLAPRESLVRVATGRDAADTSFLSNHTGNITLDDMTVTAIVDGELPVDDVNALTRLQ